MNKDYMEFAERIRKGIESVTGKEVKLHAVKKNNGVVLYGITIYTEGCNIMPTLYLESYYEDYKNGKPIKDVACEFMRDYDRSIISENIDISFFEYYERVKPLLGFKLINADMNESLLQDVPHKKIFNFAVVCYCDMPDDIVEKVGHGLILIRNEHLDIWRVDSETVIKDAMQNMQKTNPADIINMADLLTELYGDPDSLICGKLPMWVLTNRKRNFGAGAVLYDNQLEKVAEVIKGDFYVLPSSIHEVIILAAKYSMDADNLIKTVREVNEEQCDREEQLADNVYFYSVSEKKLHIIR